MMGLVVRPKGLGLPFHWLPAGVGGARRVEGGQWGPWPPSPREKANAWPPAPHQGPAPVPTEGLPWRSVPIEGFWEPGSGKLLPIWLPPAVNPVKCTSLVSSAPHWLQEPFLRNAAPEASVPSERMKAPASSAMPQTSSSELWAIGASGPQVMWKWLIWSTPNDPGMLCGPLMSPAQE